MNRKLVISDIHGCYTEFNRLLDLVNFNPYKDKLILLGDFVDRGGKSKEVVEQVIGLVRDDGVIALQGNHDERFVDVVFDRKEEASSKFFEHGGIQTIENYHVCEEMPQEELIRKFKEEIKLKYIHHAKFLDELPWFFEDEDYIYVHAGLNPNYTNWKEQPKRDFLYIKHEFFNNPTVVDKTVIFGHTKTADIQNSSNIWFGEGKIGIDGGCAYGFQLNCLEIKENNEYKTYSTKAEVNICDR